MHIKQVRMGSTWPLPLVVQSCLKKCHKDMETDPTNHIPWEENGKKGSSDLSVVSREVLKREVVDLSMGATVISTLLSSSGGSS